LPEGLLCGERLKNDVRLSVCPMFVCPDFSGKSSVTYSERDINFGFIYIGKISRSEKSKLQNAFRYLAIVTTSSFFEEKIENVLRTKYDLKIRNFYTVYMDPIAKISDFEVIFRSQNVFYFFFKKT
jgi:hypothetical protein